MTYASNLLPRRPLTLGARLLTLALFGLTACGGCDGDDDEQDMSMPPQVDMSPVEDMEADLGVDMEVKPDLDTPDLEVTPDMAPDMSPEEDMDTLPDGPEARPLTFSVFPPVPASCDDPTSRYRIPIAVIAQVEGMDAPRPLRPYDRIAERPLIPNDTVTVGSIAAERLRIAQESGDSCTTNADCANGFVCAAGGDRDATNVCLRQTGISFIPDSVKVDYDPGGGPKQQLVTVLYENSGSLLGYVPQEVGSLYDDNGQKDLFKNDARATDAATLSRVAAEQFILYLASYIDPLHSSMSVWWFAGDKSVQTIALTRTDRGEDHFDTNLEAARGKIDALPTPSARLGTGNVYQAMQRVIDKDLGLPQYADYEKFLFVIVDGPNEVWDKDATRESTLAKLEQHGIHVFFIHFDTAIDTSTVRDPLAYWAGSKECRDNMSCQKATPCNTDADCQNFEECRNVTLYGETEASGVSQSDLPYCLPKYRDDGRLGPINAYADMACRTGGNYLYLTSPRSLEPALKELPAAVDGQWSFEADISYLNAMSVPDGYYRLSGVFLGLFGNSAIGAKLSTDTYGPCFDDPTQSCVLNPDNRPLLRLGKF